MRRTVTALALGTALSGCVFAESSSGESTSDASWTVSGATHVSITSDSTGATSASNDESGDVSDGGCGFGFCDHDFGGDSIQCDIWAQDCSEDEKCVPWAKDGASSWNATRCSPLDPTPRQPGEACTVEDSGISGIDDCDIASMCWEVDPRTNMGVCVDFCQGSAANPICIDPATTCTIRNDGVLILCLPHCDPLAQSCADGDECIPEADAFVCAPDASGDLGAHGDACEFLNVCDPGLFCAKAERVFGCGGSYGCCTEFCDLDADDPNAACSGAADGETCTPWFEMGTAPPALERVGACLLPA